MFANATFHRAVRAIAAGASALLLTGCLLSPGAFTSQLDLRKDGTFAYSYEGEIYLLALSKLAELGSKMENAEAEFIEQPCYEEDTFEERACTEAELAQQRKDWDEQLAARKSEQEREAEMMRAMLGGIDPADPEAAQELAGRLERQAGWETVEYKGDGLFQVAFRIEGDLDHDFVFPTIERLPMSNFFVLVALRDGGTVRVDAPGFAAQSGGNPFQGMMAGMAGAFAGDSATDEQMPLIPELDGTFRVVTDGEILANNTDDGPAEGPAGRVLEWQVNQRTQVAPTALVRLSD